MVPGLDSLPVVDPNMHAELTEVGGAAFVVRLIEVFLTDAREGMHTLTHPASTAKNTASVAHRLKGGAAAIGARRAAAVAHAIEAAARGGEMDRVHALIPLMQTQLAALEAAT